jgi:ribosomal protein S27E
VSAADRKCPDCRNVQAVSAGTFTYRCTRCGTNVRITACPKCKREVDVDVRWSWFICPFCSWRGVLEKGHAVGSPAPAGASPSPMRPGMRVVNCPFCQQRLTLYTDSPKIVQCPQCGRNLRTKEPWYEKVGRAGNAMDRAGKDMMSIGCAIMALPILVIILVIAWFALFHH